MSDIIRTNKAVAWTSKKPPVPFSKERILFLGAISKAWEVRHFTGRKAGTRVGDKAFEVKRKTKDSAWELQAGNNALGFAKVIHVGILSKCLHFPGIQWQNRAIYGKIFIFLLSASTESRMWLLLYSQHTTSLCSGVSRNVRLQKENRSHVTMSLTPNGTIREFWANKIPEVISTKPDSRTGHPYDDKKCWVYVRK